MAKKKTKIQRDVENIIQMPSSGEREDELIASLFENSKYERMVALFDELKNGKGIARLQAEQRIAEIEKEMSVMQDTVVEIDWDRYATEEAGEALEA